MARSSTRRNEYGGSGLWRVPSAGGQPRRIAETLAFAGNPTLSRDGRRLAYTESWIDTNIYLSDLPPAGASMATAVSGDGRRRLIASTREDHSASFSPDGSRIAFISNRSGDSEVWVAARDGTQQ